MIIGAHVSTSGGLNKAIERGLAIGAQALQIFPSAPVQWKIRGFGEDDATNFKTIYSKHFKEVVFHSIYLVNLAGEEPNYTKSIDAMVTTLNLAPTLGITKTIFHTGTYLKDGGFNEIRVGQAIKTILDNTPASSQLIFENTAGSTIGAKLEDLAKLIGFAKDKSRVGVCLDTCHAYASGYDLKTPDGYQLFKSKISSLLGVEMVKAWHLNDSKFELGKKRDRHENIGEGYLGTEAFEQVVNDPDWANIAGYLEVPGFDDNGPDKRNIELIQGLKKATQEN